MGTVRTNNVQVGQSVTATNNFTLYQPATPDGTVRLGNGNSGSVTDVASFTSAGVFSFNSGYGSVAPVYGCRAWVNFNGQGTVAIKAAGNVSSITDNGVGQYTVNFATPLADTNYAYALSTVAPDTSGVNTGIVLQGTNTTIANKTTTQMNIWIGIQTANTFLDKVDVSVIIFR